MCKEKVIEFCKVNGGDFFEMFQFWDDLVELWDLMNFQQVFLVFCLIYDMSEMFELELL